MTRFLYLATMAAALAAIGFAGPAAARFEAGGAAGAAASPSTVTSQGSADTPEPAEVENEPAEANEAVGTATTNGASVTVTSAGGTSLTCAVPAGVDVTPFLSDQVKVECDVVNGVLTLRELESATGAKVEIRGDGTVETNADDQGDDNQGEQGDNHGDGDSGHGGGDGGHSGHGGGGGNG